MLSKPIAVGLIGIACVTAAAGGAYVAVRHNAAEPTAAAAAPPAPAPSAPAVQETEAVVDPTPAAPEPVERETARPEPARTAPKPAPRRERAAAPARAAVPPPEPARSTPAPALPPVAEPPARVDEPVTAAPVEPPRPEAPPTPVFEELIIPQSSVIGLQIETPVSSERARVEDRVDARVLRDVMVDGRTVLPAGSRAVGAVTLVERGGKMKDRARLGIRFHTLVLADGTRVPMRTDTILREGESPGNESARKIGGAAVGGAILGAIIGGKKGAIVGGATGAAGGSAVVMTGDRNPATLPAGAVVTVRLVEPVTIEVERR